MKFPDMMCSCVTLCCREEVLPRSAIDYDNEVERNSAVLRLGPAPCALLFVRLCVYLQSGNDGLTDRRQNVLQHRAIPAVISTTYDVRYATL